MRRIIIIILILIIGVVGLIFIKQQRFLDNKDIKNNQVKKMINILSPDFSQNEKISSRFTCDGENINPAIIIENVPDNTKSLVLIVDDPDASVGVWNHWLIWNIDPSIKEIETNSVPSGAMIGANTSGKIGYSGPCPPSGTHRYIFKIYSIDKILDLKNGSKKNAVEEVIKGHILDYGELIGLYTR